MGLVWRWDEDTASASASSEVALLGIGCRLPNTDTAAVDFPSRWRERADAASVQEKEARDRGLLQGGAARRNVNGREPRLLPFPPGMSCFSVYNHLHN